MQDIIFLTVTDVVWLYEKVMYKFGGKVGIRDAGLLHSALSQPNLVLFGHKIHQDIFEMAAAYCFYITKNHPFVDGNKRIGLLATVTFLELNGFVVKVDEAVLYQFMMQVASTDLDIKAISQFLKKHSQKI